jgi:hypothetical protein
VVLVDETAQIAFKEEFTASIEDDADEDDLLKSYWYY